MTSEILLIREKASRLSNGELANEIVRCRKGLVAAANKSAAARFARRMNIMQEEADRRMKGGVA